MVQRMTPSQYAAWVRQQQQKHNDAVRRYNQEVDRVNRLNRAAREQAVRDYNREVDRVNQHNRRVVNDYNAHVNKHNQNARAALDKYNAAVRTHNAQVERDRQRRVAALRASTAVRYVDVRRSTIELSERYDVIERTTAGRTHSDLIELSEREVGNSAAVAEALLADVPADAEPEKDTGVLEYLAGFSQDLCDRWRGAVYALNPVNPDAARHFCPSVREIFVEILDRWADNDDVLQADPACQSTPNGTGPSRRSKIQYLLKRKGANSPEMLGFVEQDIDDILQSFKVFNEATHGAAGKHGLAKLQNIRRRVEGGIMFLAAVAL